jgi:hypothetical protein
LPAGRRAAHVIIATARRRAPALQKKSPDGTEAVPPLFLVCWRDRLCPVRRTSLRLPKMPATIVGGLFGFRKGFGGGPPLAGPATAGSRLSRAPRDGPATSAGPTKKPGRHGGRPSIISCVLEGPAPSGPSDVPPASENACHDRGRSFRLPKIVPTFVARAFGFRKTFPRSWDVPSASENASHVRGRLIRLPKTPLTIVGRLFGSRKWFPRPWDVFSASENRSHGRFQLKNASKSPTADLNWVNFPKFSSSRPLF